MRRNPAKSFFFFCSAYEQFQLLLIVNKGYHLFFSCTRHLSDALVVESGGHCAKFQLLVLWIGHVRLIIVFSAILT